MAGELQLVLGAVVFLVTVAALARLLHRKAKQDWIESLSFGFALALTLPVILLLALNLILKIPINAVIAYAGFILVAGGAFFLEQRG